MDTDRLPEERERGISIALGYAPLTLPSGRRLSVVDVPGHERFVRTMVAGATGIDLFLMVVAADDGVMPQTREHAAVLRGARRDDRRRGGHEGRPAPIRRRPRRRRPSCVPGAEVVPVLGARAGRARRAARRARPRGRRLPGRAGAGGRRGCTSTASFTVRGAGTVVTGTLWSGAVGARRRA